MRLILECGWYTKGHTIKDNWLFCSQKQPNVNISSPEVETLCLPSFLHVGNWSAQGLCMSRACCPHLCICPCTSVSCMLSPYLHMSLYHVVSGKHFPSSHSSHLALKIYLPPLLHRLLKWQDIYRQPIYLGLSIPMFISLYMLIILIPQKGSDKRPL